MSAPRLYHDTRFNQPESIVTYFHCARCLNELPEGESPRSYQRVQVGLLEDGSVQVWCVRHDCNVTIMSFHPHHGLDYEGQEPIRPGDCDCCRGEQEN